LNLCRFSDAVARPMRDHDSSGPGTSSETWEELDLASAQAQMALSVDAWAETDRQRGTGDTSGVRGRGEDHAMPVTASGISVKKSKPGGVFVDRALSTTPRGAPAPLGLVGVGSSVSATSSQYWFAMGVLIVIGTFFTILIGLIRHDFKRHPANIDLMRVLCDFVFGMILVIWYARGAHQGDADCKGYAIATQFSFVASFMWFIVRTMDLHRMIKDPFSFFSSVTKKYHLIAWGVSSISVLILAFPFTTENFEKDAGDADMFGEDDYGLCWIKEVHDFNWYKFGCFTMPMTFAMAYGVYVLYLCGRYFGVGHSGTESVRQKVLQTARNQVLGFFIWWCAFSCAGSFLVRQHREREGRSELGADYCLCDLIGIARISARPHPLSPPNSCPAGGR